VVRGVTKPQDAPIDGDRPILTGSLDQLREDLASYAAAGVDEVFLDLNFDSEVGSPDADPDESVRRGLEALEALAP
jgi:hypothetical protein